MAATTSPLPPTDTPVEPQPEHQQDVENPEDDPVTTVFEDPVNFNAKHPLEGRWTMWFDNPGKRTNQATWSNNLKPLVTVDTVEDFWGTYNNVVKASALAHGSNYHLFKEGIKPEWEDPQNAKGGKWVLPLPKSKRGDLDQLWLFTVLAMIGETFPDSPEICGAVVSSRKQADRISLWTRNALDEEKAKAAGEHWKRMLGLTNEKIGYQAHSDALRKNSSFSNQDMYSL